MTPQTQPATPGVRKMRKEARPTDRFPDNCWKRCRVRKSWMRRQP